MALFTKSTPEELVERQLNQEQTLLSAYGLEDMVDSKDIEAIKRINGTLLVANKERDFAKKHSEYLAVIIEQNFMIIRQLERLLEK